MITNMFKKAVLLTVVTLSALSLYAQPLWQKDITMLIVPRDAKAIQIAQDIAEGYPILLVTYRQTGSALDLHAWNGDGWVPVSAADYTNGAFFATAPKHAILIQPDRVSVPEALIPSAAWCQSGNRLVSTDPRVLIHLLGRHFNFPYRHWMQMAKRYGYSLEQVNPGLINVYWWHFRGDVARNKLAQRDPAADADKWYELELKPLPVLPVEIPPAAEPPENAPGISPAAPAAAPAETKAETLKAPEAALPAEPAKEPAETKAEPVKAPESAAPAEPVKEPAVKADPFSDQEIPAAEVVSPQKI